MGLTDNLRRQHTEILKMAGEINHLIGGGAVKNATALRGVLARLTGVVKVHLAMEDSSMYPLMVAAKDGQIATMARRYQKEMGGLAEAYVKDSERWKQGGAIEAEAGDFTAQTSEVFGKLATRIQREDEELYPLVDKLGL